MIKKVYVGINPSLGKVGPAHHFLCVGVGRGLAIDKPRAHYAEVVKLRRPCYGKHASNLLQKQLKISSRRPAERGSSSQVFWLNHSIIRSYQW